MNDRMMKVEKECTGQGSIMEAKPVECMVFLYGFHIWDCLCSCAAGLKEPKDHGKGSQGGKIRSRKEPPEQRLELIAHRQAVKREGPGGRGIINCRIDCCL